MYGRMYCRNVWQKIRTRSVASPNVHLSLSLSPLFVASSPPIFALGTGVFSVAGALLAIPVGIKRKSLAPLVFFGTTGTMLDIIMGISQCDREHAEREMKLLEEQNAAAMGALTETGTES